MSSEGINHLGHSRFFLSHGHIDTVDVRILLVDDGIYTEGRLADLPVPNDQLTLPSANGGHGIDGLNARVHGLIHGLADDDPRGHHLDPAKLSGIDWPFAIYGITHSINDPTQDCFSNGNFSNPAGSFDGVPLFNLRIIAHDGNAHVILFQIKAETIDATWKFQHLQGHGIFHAIHTSDTITNG